MDKERIFFRLGGKPMFIYLQMIESDSDKDKFEQIYLKYRGLMYHSAFTILRNREDSEDVVHQAFVSIIENFDKLFKKFICTD